jgi:phosphoglucosamine mutase
LTPKFMAVKIKAIMKLFGTSGIRGIANEDLIQLALKVGLAVGKDYRRAVVATDTRTSSPAMKHALISGLLAAGASSYDAGVIPTPTLALAARELDAGVIITASHNPPEYNGIKLWNPDGSAFDAQQRQQLEDQISSSAFASARWDEIQSSRLYHQAIEQHIERISADFPDRLKLKVVVDCGCGAASVITPHLLRKLGCSMVALNCHPSGFFPRPVEPTESNLGDLMKATRELGADLGIAHDGDADRMMVVDDKGDFVPGDKLLVLFARALEAKEVVTTIDASMAIDETGFAVSRTRVGDSYVSEELRKGGDFGGEPSGSWIFPGISLCPDGIYAAALVAAIASRQKLSLQVDSIPSYPLLRGSISSSGIIISRLESQLTTMKPISVSTVDGIKLSFDDGWLLVRASGTEPKIRLTAEAKSEAKAHRLYDDGIEAIKECIG